MDFLAKNNITGEITYLDILNDDFTLLTDDEADAYELGQQNTIKKASLQSQIDALERVAGVRAFREYMLDVVKDVGAKTTDYPNGKTLDIDNQIKDLRVQMAVL